jgi:spore maturation protein SpmB
LKNGVADGLRKGWSGFIWMLEILVPVSFFTVLLEYSGWLDRIDFLLSPLMGLLSLPPAAALPILVGMLTGIYGAIAAMSVLPFTVDQMTLMAIFVLISHNLVQEGIIQGRSGINPILATVARLTASVLTVVVVARFLDAGADPVASAEAAGAAAGDLSGVLADWCVATAYLSLKIFVIIMALMVIMGLMKQFNLISAILRPLTPALKALGLDREVGLLWLTAVVFGLSYGAAVIVEETRDGRVPPEMLTRLHVSIGINHSMVEDPALFLPLGIGAFWLWVPRLITAILAVRLVAFIGGAGFQSRQGVRRDARAPRGGPPA